MPALRSLVSPFAAALLCAAAVATTVRPAAAQQPSAAPRTVAVYRLAAPATSGLPTVVTVADSAGQLVASYRLPGTRTAQPLMLTVIGSDIVLQGETPAGVLTLQLYRQNEPGADRLRVAGRWALGDAGGQLRRGRTAI